MEKEHQAHVDSLKVTTAKKAQSAEGARELAAAVDAADGLKVLSQECQHGLHQIRSATAALPSLIDSLGGKRDNNKKSDQAAEYQKAQAQRAQARGRLEQSAEKSGWGDLEEVTSAAVSTAVL